MKISDTFKEQPGTQCTSLVCLCISRLPHIQRDTEE
jgi:hypothetical protein